MEDTVGPQKVDYRIIADGGTRNGNPGDAYGSFLLSDSRGQTDMVRLRLGRGTNNEAEYMTIVAALGNLISRIRRGKRAPAEFTVEVVTDSRLVVGHLSKGWELRAPNLVEHCQAARRYLDEFGEWTLTWVSRDEIVPVLGH